MRILILSQYYWPDISANAQYVTDIATELVDRGHEVSVIVSRAVQHGGHRLAPAFERDRGVDIHRTKATNVGKGKLLGRIADYSSYVAMAAIQSVLLRKQDVVLALTTPPLAPLLGPMLQKLRGSAFVYLTEDIYPDIAVEMGKIPRGSPLAQALHACIGWSQRSADRVIVIGRCMRDLVISKGVDPARISLVQNWADPEELYPIPQDENPMVEELGLKGKFALVYSGNMGWGHDFSTFLDAAERLRDEDDLRFVFIGAGYRRAEIEQAREERGLHNVMMLPYQPREALLQSLNLGQAALVSQRVCVDGLLVPSKLYGILANGKPILFVGSRTCEVGRTIEELDCGFVLEQGDVDGLVAAINTLRDDEKRREGMGLRARDALVNKYQRRLALDQYERILEEAVAERRAR